MIIAITGPAGSGKSTIGEKLAKRLDKCVNIDADHVKHMVVSGFHKDDTNAGGWSFSEWGLVGESIGLLAKNFQDKGFDVVINGYIDEPAWSEIEKQVELTYKFLLLPELEEVKNRDKHRTGDLAMGDVVVAEHHDHFSTSDTYSDFIKIDSTNHAVDETAGMIIDELKN